MTINLENISLTDIMPSNLLTDSTVSACVKVLDPHMQQIASEIQYCLLISRIDSLSEDVIDLLAWQFHVDFYDADLAITEKRTLVKQSIAWHKKKGTPAAVKYVVSAILSGATISEWFNYNGQPYHFKVTDIEGNLPDSDTVDKLVKAINVAKNTRSWLDGIEFKRNINQTIYYSGIMIEHKIISIGLPSFKVPNATENQYISSVHHIHKEVTIANG